MSGMCGFAFFFTSPFGGEVGAKRRVRGPFSIAESRKGPLTRPKSVDLSPKGRGEEEHINV